MPAMSGTRHCETMDAKQYVEQLKREAKAHPAKAALLAVMCCVLAYVCLPLIIGSKKDEATVAAIAKQKSHTTKDTIGRAIGTPDAKPRTAEREILDWRGVSAAIDADQRTNSAVGLGGDRDPFAPPPEPKLAENDEESKEDQIQQPAPRKVHFTPDEAGLVLGSTLLGTSRPVAMINGKPYRVYDPKRDDNRRSAVPFASDLQINNDNAYFVLVDIQPRSVSLWRSGRRHELNLPGLTLAESSASSIRATRPNPVIPPSALTP